MISNIYNAICTECTQSVRKFVHILFNKNKKLYIIYIYCTDIYIYILLINYYQSVLYKEILVQIYVFVCKYLKLLIKICTDYSCTEPVLSCTVCTELFFGDCLEQKKQRMPPS